METLTTPAALDARLARPGAWWLFKHSRTCPISGAARTEFDAFLAAHPGEPAALVVVQDHRPVSDHAARVLGVKHETPQAFLVRDGKPVWHASHGGITQDSLEEARAAAAR
ncbi:MAG TPA: bacillithiol system redox-active protein YtxJ [Planctomycetota bacterium]|nr:bacillithiol system redox-active protein YtxJ [Planctomycetota bacterium]